jgi:hypothetical protein
MPQPEKLSIPCWETASLPAHIGARPLEQYQYQKLGSEKELRLLHVRQSTDCCSFEIVHHDLSENLKYETVSYVWGSPERTHTLLLGDNATFALTSSLSTALPYLAARSTTGYLWIDQICINQADVEERNIEVPKMGSIYESATRVIAWLGEDNSETRLVQDIIETAGEMPKESTPKGSNYLRGDSKFADSVSSLFSVQQGQDSYLHALSHFLRNPWFRRTWCFQEAILGGYLSLLVGKFELQDALEPLYSAILGLNRRSDKVEEYRQVHLSKSTRPLKSMVYERRRIHLRGPRTPFHVLLSDIGAYGEASDPRDIVYGFLGLQTNPNITLEANYSLSEEEAIIASSRAIIIGNRSLDIFNAIRLPGYGRYQLPSWVPDWSSPGNFTVIRNAWDHRKENTFAASAGRCYTPLASQERFSALTVRGRSIACLHYLPRRHEAPKEWSKHSIGFTEIICYLPLNAYVEQIQRDCPLLENVSREKLLSVVLTDGRADTEQARQKITTLLRRYDILCSEEERSKLPRSTLDASVRDLYLLANPIYTRRIFCTMDGRLGIGPSNAQIGDDVAIIHGSRLPLMLRPTGTGEYKLVGVCYLEGVMKGEACTWPENEADEYILV